MHSHSASNRISYPAFADGLYQGRMIAAQSNIPTYNFPIHKDPADPLAKVLPASFDAEVIEDGIGFGGIHIGAKESELLQKWGKTIVKPNNPAKVYVYFLDGGTMVFVQVNKGEVAVITFLFNFYGAGSVVQTSKGIKLTSSNEEVKEVYGDPDSNNRDRMFYSSRGIGFQIVNDKWVYTILIFKPGESIEKFVGPLKSEG